MAKLIALTGGMYSGKSTLANYLNDRHGYDVANFSYLLKQYAAKALQACGIPVHARDIADNKSRYRAFLQDLGVLIGFDDDPKYIYETLDKYTWSNNPVVFDNVRTEAQATTLRSLGFKIVRLSITPQERTRRAQALGVSNEALLAQMLHPVEQGIGTVDLTLDGTQPIEYNGTLLVNLGTDR